MAAKQEQDRQDAGAGEEVVQSRDVFIEETETEARGSDVATARKAVARLEETVAKKMAELEKLREAELRSVRRHAVEVTLDPDTAQPKLSLCADGKRVSHGVKKWKRKEEEGELPDNPERFDVGIGVLGKEGFPSGRFYYEVRVRDKTAWTVGVARESVGRKGDIRLSPQDGYWTVGLRNGGQYMALADSRVRLLLKRKPQRVGVFVDHEEGTVSFYDVKAKAHIYSFTGCGFAEKLRPYFNPGFNKAGVNSAPLIITPMIKPQMIANVINSK